MVFSSLVFLFGFLPIVLLLGVLTQRIIKLQNFILLLASFLFYSWGEPRYIWLFIATVIVNWGLVLVSNGTTESLKITTGMLAIAFDVGILIWFKYASWVGEMFNCTIGNDVLPIGISFYTFQAISYVADVSFMKKYEAEKNPINVGLYISFFPQLIAGPIVRYQDIREQIQSRKMTIESFETGCFRFVLGFCKKVLLADSMAIIVNNAFSDVDKLSFSLAWLGALAFTMQIFMDFSGYSDMAIGLGDMFGFIIPENFNCPYKAYSIRDFWRRWHMTLSIWFRDYIYIPLGGNRCGRVRTILNVSAVWLLTGVWHGANATFVIWGGVYGMLVLAEKYFHIEEKVRTGTVVLRYLYRVFTLIVIVCLWVIFRADNWMIATRYLNRMIHFSSNAFDVTLLYLNEFKWAFLGCILLSVVSTDSIKRERTYLWPVLLFLFIVSVSYLVKGTFCPFLYFNF